LSLDKSLAAEVALSSAGEKKESAVSAEAEESGEAVWNIRMNSRATPLDQPKPDWGAYLQYLEQK
jgi:hypothetical protein